MAVVVVVVLVVVVVVVAVVVVICDTVTTCNTYRQDIADDSLHRASEVREEAERSVPGGGSALGHVQLDERVQEVLPVALAHALAL